MNIPARLVVAGTESYVYVTDDNPPIIIKKKRPNGRTQYLFEAYAYKELGRLNARVPNVLDATEDTLKLSAYEGKELDDQEQLYSDKTLFLEIASDLALCRQVTFSGFGPAIRHGDDFAGKFNNWQDFLSSELSHLEASLRNSNSLTQREIEKLFNFWRKIQPEISFDSGEGMLVHGDFAMSAIFVHNDKYEGIIDFGDAFIGDPLMDIAHFRFKEITKGYGDDVYQLLLNSYLQISPSDSQHTDKKIMFYMAYWAAKRLHQLHGTNLEAKFAAKAKKLLSHSIFDPK